MAVTIGEAREAWGLDVMRMVEDFANKMKGEDKPFYIVYAAKPDRHNDNTFRQTIKAYSQKPAPLLGILVWYVNNATGELTFMPELSAPPDVPIDPSLLSQRASDEFTQIMGQGKKMKVLLS